LYACFAIFTKYLPPLVIAWPANDNGAAMQDVRKKRKIAHLQTKSSFVLKIWYSLTKQRIA